MRALNLLNELMLAQDVEYSIRKKYRQLKVGYLKIRQDYPLNSLPWRRLVPSFVLVTLIISSSPVASSSSSSSFPPSGEKDSRFNQLADETPVSVPSYPVTETGAVKGVSTFKDLAETPLAKSPERIPDSPDLPALTAKAALFTDLVSGATLFEINPHQELPPASLTKMMTALVAVESYPLDEEIIVPSECLVLPDSQKIGLVAGETLSARSLLTGLLVFSASDAACALSTHKTTVTEFVSRMNLKAASLGMKNTKFANPIGLDEVSDDQHYSTAGDLLVLTKAFLKDEFLRQVVSLPDVLLTSTDGKYSHKLVSTNELLKSYSGISGVKTGYTSRAGGCFISLFNRGGHEIIGIILGSGDRFGETKAVLEWVYSVYRWR